MPRPMNNVTLTSNPDGTIAIQIGPSTYTVEQAALFERAFSLEHLRTNLRLAFLIGGYTQLDSTEYLTGVNRGNHGVRLKDGNYAIKSVKLTDPNGPTYEIGVGPLDGVANQFFQAGLNDLTQDLQDEQVILDNLNCFLRLGGHTSLTPAAINAVKAATFWY